MTLVPMYIDPAKASTKNRMASITDGNRNPACFTRCFKNAPSSCKSNSSYRLQENLAAQMPIFFIAIIKLPMSIMDTGNQLSRRKHYETEGLHLILVQDLPAAWSGPDNADYNDELHPKPSIDCTIIRKGTHRDSPAGYPDLFDGRISSWENPNLFFLFCHQK